MHSPAPAPQVCTAGSSTLRLTASPPHAMHDKHNAFHSSQTLLPAQTPLPARRTQCIPLLTDTPACTTNTMHSTPHRHSCLPPSAIVPQRSPCHVPALLRGPIPAIPGGLRVRTDPAEQHVRTRCVHWRCRGRPSRVCVPLLGCQCVRCVPAHAHSMRATGAPVTAASACKEAPALVCNCACEVTAVYACQMLLMRINR